MNNLLLKLMLSAGLLQAGISMSDAMLCNTKQCQSSLEKASREVLNIDWKPISIFPNEAQRFR